MAQLRPAVILPPRGEGHAKTPLFQLLRPALPTVVRVQEPRRLLHPGPFAKQPDVLSLSFVDGTVAGCREGDEVRLVANAAELLAAELRALPRLPRAVLLSPSTDPFPPLNEVQHTTVRLVEVLARHGIDAWLMTRGYIRPAALDALPPAARLRRPDGDGRQLRPARQRQRPDQSRFQPGAAGRALGRGPTGRPSELTRLLTHF